MHLTKSEANFEKVFSKSMRFSIRAPIWGKINSAEIALYACMALSSDAIQPWIHFVRKEEVNVVLSLAFQSRQNLLLLLFIPPF